MPAPLFIQVNKEIVIALLNVFAKHLCGKVNEGCAAASVLFCFCKRLCNRNCQLLHHIALGRNQFFIRNADRFA